MDIYKLVADCRNYVLAEMEKRFYRLFGFTRVASSSPLGNDAVENYDGQPGQHPAQRLEPYGFRSRPPKGVRSFQYRPGMSNMAYLGTLPSGAYGPQDLDVGESAQFCSAAGTEVKLDKNGNVIVNAAAGANVTINGEDVNVNATDDVIVNGGSLSVARKTDTVDPAGLVTPPDFPVPGSMFEWMTTVTTVLNGLVPGAVSLPTSFGVISSGSTHFKA